MLRGNDGVSQRPRDAVECLKSSVAEVAVPHSPEPLDLTSLRHDTCPHRRDLAGLEDVKIAQAKQLRAEPRVVATEEKLPEFCRQLGTVPGGAAVFTSAERDAVGREREADVATADVHKHDVDNDIAVDLSLAARFMPGRR